MRDLAARLLLQLGAGGLVVDAQVVGVGELIQHLPLPCARPSWSARSRAYSMPPLLGVRISSAPKPSSSARARCAQGPRHDQHHAVAAHAAAIASAMPVLPEVASISVSPGDLAALLGAPGSSSAGRSFTPIRPGCCPRACQHHVAALAVGLRANALQRDQRRAGRQCLPA